MVECYGTEQRKARKEYECQLCGEKILKGRDYIYEHGLYDGKFFNHRQHIHCNAIFEAYFAEPHTDLEYSEDEIWDYVREVCSGCPMYEYDECEKNPYFCQTVIEKRVPENLWGAALESIKANREDGP